MREGTTIYHSWPCTAAGPAGPARTLMRLRQLIENRGVFQRGHILRNLVALGHYTQQAPHDLARTGLGQVFAETYVFGLGNWTDLTGYPIAQLLGDAVGLVTFRQGLVEYDESHHSLARSGIGASDHCGLGYQVVRDQC